MTPREGEHSHNHLFPMSPQISPACSTNDRTSRCHRLYIESSAAGFIILAPLQNAVGFIEFRYEVDKLLRINKGVLSITDRLQMDRCVPLEIVLYREEPMVLYLNEEQLMCTESLRYLPIFPGALRAFATSPYNRYIPACSELVRMKTHVLNIMENAPLGRCVPLEVIHYEEQPKVLCLNDRRNLASCDVILNRSDISQSSLKHCDRLHTTSTCRLS